MNELNDQQRWPGEPAGADPMRRPPKVKTRKAGFFSVPTTVLGFTREGWLAVLGLGVVLSVAGAVRSAIPPPYAGGPHPLVAAGVAGAVAGAVAGVVAAAGYGGYRLIRRAVRAVRDLGRY